MALPMPTFANCQKRCRFPFKARELGSPIRLRTGRVCFCWTECLAGNSGGLPTVLAYRGGAGEAAHFTGGVKKGPAAILRYTSHRGAIASVLGYGGYCFEGFQTP